MSANLVDVESLVSGIERMRNAGSGQAYAVSIALGLLRSRRVFPDAYIDGIEQEMLQMLGAQARTPKPVSVYLAFHGENGIAKYMKVGIAANVSNRMKSLYTGSPLPRLMVYSAVLPKRSAARRVEGALHAHLSSIRTSGEWFGIGGISLDALGLYSDSLAEVATAASGSAVAFQPFED